MGIFDFFKTKSAIEKISFPSGRPSRSTPPKSQGWYRIIKNTGEKIYAGISNNMNRRMKEHIKTGKLSSGHIFEHKKVDNIPYSSLRLKEVQKIKQYGNPPLNKNRGGGGRLPK